MLILHARIQSLKESGVVAMESFSNELMEVIVHKCSKKRCFRNIGEIYTKTPNGFIDIWTGDYNEGPDILIPSFLSESVSESDQIWH